jgi:hypothetical protein
MGFVQYFLYRAIQVSVYPFVPGDGKNRDFCPGFRKSVEKSGKLVYTGSILFVP